MNSWVRWLVCVLLVPLSACSPQWSEPVFKSQAVTPSWLEGLWIDESGSTLRLLPKDGRFVFWYTSDTGVILSTALVTSYDKDFFFSLNLKDLKVLASEPQKEEVYFGYHVMYLDRVTDDHIRLTEPDYPKIFARLEPDKRIGTDTCAKLPLLGRTLQVRDSPLAGSDSACVLLDTNAVGGSLLERSDKGAEFFRVKVRAAAGSK
jgi:hypothetical protein